jgi:hypothetical protein
LARSSPGRSSTPTRADVSGARTAPDAFLALPRIAGGVDCGLLDDVTAALQLFAFAAAATPPPSAIDCALGAWLSPEEPPTSGATEPVQPLVGALLIERAGPAAMLHGPVVIVERARVGQAREPLGALPGGDPQASPGPGHGVAERPGIAIAADLVAAALELASRRGTETIFVRPQGLDRIWVRFGFIPVPEVALPGALRGRPGAGLFAYRGGSALWSIREARPT